MFEIANPYRGTLRFDKAGQPIAQDPGHGIGARSVSAFCEKHSACCAYETRNGWFYLKIALEKVRLAAGKAAAGTADMKNAPRLWRRPQMRGVCLTA